MFFSPNWMGAIQVPFYSKNWPTNLISIESCPHVTYFLEIIPRRMPLLVFFSVILGS
jgi:hypothetical protein